MVKLELQFESLEEAVRALTAINPALAVIETTPSEAAKPAPVVDEAPLEEEKPKRTRKAKAAKPEPETEPEPEVAQTTVAEVIDYAATSALVIEYGKRTSPGEALELMQKATGGRLQKLSQADEPTLRAVYDAFKEALQPEAEAA